MVSLTQEILKYYATIGGITIVWNVARWAVGCVIQFITTGELDL